MTRSIRSLAGALAAGVLLAVAPRAADSSVGGHYHSIYRNPANEYGRGRAAGAVR